MMQKGGRGQLQPKSDLDQKRSLIRIFWRHSTRVKFTEVRLGLSQQREWLAGLYDPAGVQHHDAVIIQDCIEFMRHRDNGVVTKFLTDDALHDLVCFGVDTTED